jgi:hypothetical protein
LYFNNNLLLFGGIKELTQEKNDVAAFDLEEWKWKQVDANQISKETSSRVPAHHRGLALKSHKDANKKSKGKSALSISPDHGSQRIMGGGTLDTSRLYYSPRAGDKSMSRAGDNSVLSTSRKELVVSNSVLREKEAQMKHHKEMISRSAMQDQHEKARIEQKERMLADLNKLPEDKRMEMRQTTPMTETMKLSLAALGEKFAPVKHAESGPKDEVLLLRASSSMRYVPKSKPCIRDGHTAVLYKANMIVFGGQRHTMAMNDLFQFNIGTCVFGSTYDFDEEASKKQGPNIDFKAKLQPK